MYYKGDILEADKREFHQGRHKILIWGHYEEGSDFEGIILTHSSSKKYSTNILLDSTHIAEGYKFGWENTHFVNQLFIKLSEWGPFEKVGEMTEEGIMFINDQLTNIEPMNYMDFK
ncbi:hypothetical protein [Fulvivirga ligni]|uniref:hypothetical protein n=1 Tax=Fulvivirga ligni TaxID=2904246 RepID=UPI001F2068DB|nr:hypothetical protein [Fulvivirga ligni]UII19392.1 hypothetical protein LVD16_16255 [Fulvivirga ligni]